ncbi:MAG: metal ABC transporter permease, partial [Planctomycetota bacterium]
LSSLIGADRHDVYAFAALTGVCILLIALAHRQIILVATDPETALAVGIPQRRYALASTAFVGILLGCSIHTAGSLFTFACLVLPPLAAKSLCTTTRSMFVVAPILAGSSCFLAFMLADYYDYPPGQLAAGLLAGLVLLLRLLIRR